MVVPAEAGTRVITEMDSRFRGNDELMEISCKHKPAERAVAPTGPMRGCYASAVTGSIIFLTSVTFVAGNPLRLACSSISATLSAM